MASKCTEMKEQVEMISNLSLALVGVHTKGELGSTSPTDVKSMKLQLN